MPKPSDDYNPDALTWAAMLGRWVDFARSSVALPDDAAGRKLKASVPDLIQLQAVWFALQHLGDLPASEQALGRDRAGVLIERHAAALHERFANEGLPAGMVELIDDARAARAPANPPSEPPTDS